MNKVFKIGCLTAAFFWAGHYQSQEVKELTIKQATELALQHHPQLAVSEKKIEIAKQNTEISKLQKLPSITASTSQFYLGNSLIIDKDFSNSMSVQLPHYGSSYGIQASQVIFKGGLIKKSIEITALQEQLSELDYEKDQQDVKFLVMSNYLDVLKIINQKQVYDNNKKLAQIRLDNVKKFYQQGMVTRNEIIRGELGIMNINQGLLVLTNNQKILNYNLNNALGLAENTEIVPVENIEKEQSLNDLNYYIDLAHENNPSQKYVKRSIEISDKNIEIINTDKMPTIAGFGGYTLNKPITSSSPVVDMYSGGYQVGVSLSYNIDNLYKTKKKLQLGQLQKEQAEKTYNLVEQNINMQVNAAFINHQNAIENLVILKEAQTLADENYKITEAKYLNQLAVQAEMTDAQNQKIQAELDYVNAEIDLLYQYYNLLKATGTL
ncbi:TolC family protein [Kaistella flava (ex Peng et al. 2021)]|uniref:TolC family protein n=1 Tax=Kaistella flava (ex Peng et al. 2021) TaxID=2038776 RepID=A0A7M2Y759_9FLAO|nr:TolC family protein [Kaistella flava (ex Peng et al. 2021)]QOW09504.1 TolC family protein [Kaistella flava (ex Peng et al. 2021)]